MRFLQIEWHNHERARNAWDIERAEMKAKIAKQEGECRHAKRINEQLDRQVRMLEMALMNERAKSKAAAAKTNANGNASTGTNDGKLSPSVVTGEKEAQSKAKDTGKEEETGKPSEDQVRRMQEYRDLVCDDDDSLTFGAAVSVHHNSFLDTAAENPQETSETEREQYLDNTTKYLKNCMKEIQYLLTPPQHPPQILSNGNYSGLPEPPLSVEEMYARQRNQRPPGQALPQQSAMPEHQPPPVPNNLPQTSAPHEDANRGVRYAEYSNISQPPSEILQPTAQQIPQQFDDQVERITHTFDARGRPVTDTEVQQQQQQQRSSRQQIDADGWTFEEEPPPAHPEGALPDIPQPRRPDNEVFLSANDAQLSAKSPPRTGPPSHRRKSSGSQAMSRRRSSQGKTEGHDGTDNATSNDPTQFRVRFALRGHLDVVRSVMFTGGGTPSEPEVCTAGDDGTLKRWIIPATYQNFNPNLLNADLDITAYFTHRGHEGIVTSLATCPAGFSTGGRASGDGWVFSGGQDATVRVWERGRVDPKATLQGHTDAVWAVCILPASVGVVFGPQSNQFGGPDRLLLVSGSADGTVKVWAVSSPPQVSSPSSGSRRGVGGSRRHSVTSGSNFPSSPQPSVASTTPFYYTLIHSIERPPNTDSGGNKASPTSICPLSASGETFVVSYTDSSVLIFDTRTGEEIIGMASNETYDGTMNTSINSVVATSLSFEGAAASALDATRGLETEEVGGGATGSREGVEGVVISGHEDRFVRFFDANSGKLFFSPSFFKQWPFFPILPSRISKLILFFLFYRPMYIHHARSPIRHLRSLPVQRRPRSRFRRPRRQHPLLVARKTHLHSRYHLPSRHARRGGLRRLLESGWPTCRQCWWRWGGESLCKVKAKITLLEECFLLWLSLSLQKEAITRAEMISNTHPLLPSFSIHSLSLSRLFLESDCSRLCCCSIGPLMVIACTDRRKGKKNGKDGYVLPLHSMDCGGMNGWIGDYEREKKVERITKKTGGKERKKTSTFVFVFCINSFYLASCTLTLFVFLGQVLCPECCFFSISETGPGNSNRENGKKSLIC